LTIERIASYSSHQEPDDPNLIQSDFRTGDLVTSSLTGRMGMVLESNLINWLGESYYLVLWFNGSIGQARKKWLDQIH
jgi:hypothetical protein